MIDSEDELRAGDRTAGDDGHQGDQDRGEDPRAARDLGGWVQCSVHVRCSRGGTTKGPPGKAYTKSGKCQAGHTVTVVGTPATPARAYRRSPGGSPGVKSLRRRCRPRRWHASRFGLAGHLPVVSGLSDGLRGQIAREQERRDAFPRATSEGDSRRDTRRERSRRDTRRRPGDDGAKRRRRVTIPSEAGKRPQRADVVL